MSQSPQSKPRYRTTNWKQYNAALKARGSLTIKNLFGLALRQTTGFVQSLLALSGLRWPVPDFSTVYRRQRSLQVHVPYRSSQAGLHRLMDSTGIKFLGEGEWKCKKARARAPPPMAQAAHRH